MSVPELFAEALRRHQAGDLAAAEQLYRQIVAHDGRHADSLHFLGIIAAQTGRAAEAVDLIGQAIAIQDGIAAYHSNLGNVLKDQGEAAQAIPCYERALALKPDFAEAHFNLGNLLAGESKRDAAISCYRRAIGLKSDFAAAHYNLAHLLREQGALDQAAGHYERTAELKPEDAEAHFNLGNVLHSLGKAAAAADCYGRTLRLAPAMAEAHSNLGNALKDLGKDAEAEACFVRAIGLKPDFAEAHYNLGNALSDRGETAGAIGHFQQAIALRPEFPEARYNLANALKEQDDLDGAVAQYVQAIALRPAYAEALLNLGNALKAQDKLAAAVACYRQALQARPDFPDAQFALGGVLLLLGESEEAHRLFRQVHSVRPLNTKRAFGRTKGDFSVLLLTAPGAGHTPSAYLVSRAAYDSNFLLMLPDATYDIDLLRAAGDVVFNLVSDVDQSRAILPFAIDLVDRLQRPVINHPRKILATGRDAIAARLAGIARCRIPRTLRVSAPLPASGLEDFAFPLLVRVSGSHGGDNFEKVTDLDSLNMFLSRKPGADHYLSEYIPYESADGYFRKYRLIFIGGGGRHHLNDARLPRVDGVFPYHLAIANHWKVHYFRTDMANQEWMRREEEAFVSDPSTVFGPEQWAALRAIQAAIDLDYFGIDCALDPDGNVLVFEVNATMLVHDEKSIFAYKAPYIARIKQAFDAMLRRAL